MNGMPFQASTITSDEVPIPSANRPGARPASVAADIAMVAGPRVNAGTIAVPSRSAGRAGGAADSGRGAGPGVNAGTSGVPTRGAGAHGAPRTGGVKPSAAPASPVQASV